MRTFGALRATSRPWRHLTIAVAASALFATFLGTAASPARASGPSESAALIAALPKYTCPADAFPVTPHSASSNRYGAILYHYAMAKGPGFDYIVPSANFRPLQASNAELASMGMETRPSGGSKLAAWKSYMGVYKGTKKPALCQSKTPFSKPAGARGLPPSTSGGQAAHYGNNHWSGYVNYAGGYTAVGARWYQTGAYTCGCPGPTDEVTWVGIGGWAGNQLLQDGTRNYSNTQPYSWFQYLPQDATIMARNGTGISDTIEAQVIYNPTTTTTNFRVYDNGLAAVSVNQTNTYSDWDPRTAEFINERPDECPPDGCYFRLTNTQTTNFWDANAVNSAGEIPASHAARSSRSRSAESPAFHA